MTIRKNKKPKGMPFKESEKCRKLTDFGKKKSKTIPPSKDGDF